MVKRKLLFTAMIILSLSLQNICKADDKAEGFPKVSVSRYQGGRVAGVALTFDDTKTSQVKVVAPIFKEYGLRCSFFIVTSRVNPKRGTSWEDWKKLSDEGFEIGNHTKAHRLGPKKAELSVLKKQIEDGYNDIEKNIGVPPYIFAFPGGSRNDATLAAFEKTKHITYRNRRIFQEVIHRKFTNFSMKCTEDNIDTFIDAVDVVISKKPNKHKRIFDSLVVIEHDIKDKEAATLRKVLDYIKTKDDQLWCAPFRDLFRYEKERDNSKLDVSKKTSNGVKVSLSNDLDMAIYNVPLTIVVDTGSNAKEATAVCDGANLKTKIVNSKVMVDIVPNSKPVMISWKK